MTPPAETREIPYRPAVAGSPFEVFTLAALIDRVGVDELTSQQQLDFELVIVSDGHGRHEVDVVDVDIDPHRLLHIRPGQIHRWILEPAYDATLVLLRPVDARTDWTPGPRVIELTAAERTALEPVLALANHRPRSALFGVQAVEATYRLLVATLQLEPRSPTQAEPLYLDFRRAIEANHHRLRSVAEYARQLGCSTRTLARACVRATGTPPKALIDQEVCLAAQRLLSLPEATVGAVAAELGFDDVSNFTKFFARTTGQPPSSWSRGRT